MTEISDKTPEEVRFGRSIRDAFFMYDKTSCHINHGSWGGVSKPVWNARIREMEAVEFQPDTFFRRTFERDWFRNLEVIAEFVGSKPENLVFVENATTGVNCVMKSLPFQPGDVILVNSWSYGSCVKTCRVGARMRGASVKVWEIKYPIKNKEDLIESFGTFLDENPEVKVAMIDYISSATATLFPIREMISLCKSHNVIALVDGAHCPGQVELNLEELGADIFIGNLHKWMYSPRGCAIMWVHPDLQKVIKPIMTSAILDHNDFRYDFYYQGTRDATPYMCVSEALKFYKQIGGLPVITQYTKSLLKRAAEHLVEVWGTEIFPIPDEMLPPNMRIVRLPDLPKFPAVITDKTSVFCDLWELMKELFERYNIHCTCLCIQGSPWMRLSANVYNSFEEYETVGKCVLELQKM